MSLTVLAAGLAIFLVQARLLGGSDEERWEPRSEWALGAAVVAGVASWMLWGLGPIAYARFPFAGSDFGDYIADIRTVFHHAPGQLQLRSTLLGLPAAVLAPVTGIFCGLATSILASFIVVCSCVYALGRALGGRWAAMLATATLGTSAVFVGIPRMTTFYPMSVAITAASWTAAAGALLWPTLTTTILGGLACGVMAAAEPRALVTLPGPVFLIFMGCLRQAEDSRSLRMGALLGCLAASWAIAWSFHLLPSPALPGQMRQYYEDAARLANLPCTMPDTPTEAQAFTWGRGGLADILPSLRYINEVRTRFREAVAAAPSPPAYPPWRGPVAALAALFAAALITLRKDPHRMLFLAVYVACSAAPLAAASRALAHPRFLLQGGLGLPLLIGLGIAALSRGHGRATAIGWAARAAAILCVVALPLAKFDLLDFASFSVSGVDSEPAITWWVWKRGLPHPDAPLAPNVFSLDATDGSPTWPFWIEEPRPESDVVLLPAG